MKTQEKIEELKTFYEDRKEKDAERIMRLEEKVAVLLKGFMVILEHGDDRSCEIADKVISEAKKYEQE